MEIETFHNYNEEFFKDLTVDTHVLIGARKQQYLVPIYYKLQFLDYVKGEKMWLLSNGFNKPVKEIKNSALIPFLNDYFNMYEPTSEISFTFVTEGHLNMTLMGLERTADGKLVPLKEEH